MAHGTYLIRQGPEISGIQAMLYTDANSEHFRVAVDGYERDGWRVVEKEVWEVARLIEVYGLGQVRDIIRDIIAEGVY
jgi:hypothetical protein